jgi:hypothetical protein
MSAFTQKQTLIGHSMRFYGAGISAVPAAHRSISLLRSGELISNSTSADASKNTCFKGRLETVSPSESTELQRKRHFRERI